jgi:5-formyltetrahydrofolate cyclo-ligase
MAAQRRALPAADRVRAGLAVERHVLAMPEFIRARRVVLYAALPDEVPTLPLASAVQASGRALLLPNPTSGSPGFARVGDLGALRAGRCGGSDPLRDQPSEALDESDLVLVPGTAFDARGGRLGRGRGWFDRALPSGSHAPAVFGVAFAFQIVAEVPMEAHDRRLDGVVTEDGVLRAASRGAGHAG